MTRAGWRSPSWPAYGACAWALSFAAFSFYYALGGTVGIGLQAIAIQEQANDPGFIAVLWITGALKVVAGALALALVRPWGRRVPRRPLLLAAWATGVLLALYGGAGLVQAALWELGVQRIPTSVGTTAARWKFFFEPFWLLGGILFIVAARRFGRDGGGPTTSSPPSAGSFGGDEPT